jgi:hypothetical protein
MMEKDRKKPMEGERREEREEAERKKEREEDRKRERKKDGEREYYIHRMYIYTYIIRIYMLVPVTSWA